MNSGHLSRRPLRRQCGFSWCRLVDEQRGTVTWRLFMRDSAGRCLMEAHTFKRDDSRERIARILRGMRAQLRWRHDQIEFSRLGLEDTTPMPKQVAP